LGLAKGKLSNTLKVAVVDRRRFNKSILASIQMAEELGLEPQTIQPSSLPNNSRLRALVDDGSTYLSYYHETVDLRHLNFFIGSGDILQFSFFEQGRTFSLRYAFFGSPYRPVPKPIELVAVASETGEPSSSVREISSEGENVGEKSSDGEIKLEVEDGLLEEVHEHSEVDGAGLSLRYEYAEDEYRRLIHPCAHLHLGWQREGRIPVRRVWTPELFTAFVIRNIFADLWFSPRNINIRDMDGYKSEMLFKREKENAKRVHDSMFHAFETQVSFID
jgi:hypothetical protein